MSSGFKINRSASTSQIQKHNLNLPNISTPQSPQSVINNPPRTTQRANTPNNVQAPKQIPNTFDLSDIKVTDIKRFPLELDIAAEIQNALAAGVFKNVQNESSNRFFEKFCDMVFTKKYLKMVNLLFWTIHLLKFQADADMELLAKIRAKLGKVYGKYFATLIHPKEELSNHGILTAGYICHVMFYNIFPKDRNLFDMRFILNCYHIVIHELNGIFVSDFYVQSSIEKLFGTKFFFFEQNSDDKKTTFKVDLRDEPLLRDLSYDFRNFSQIPGGLSFAKELATKLKIPTKKVKTTALKDLAADRSFAKSAATSPKKNIMRLTELEETMDGSSFREGFFPKLKLNCHQISPTVSNYLDNMTSSLPCQKKKMVTYSNNKPTMSIEVPDFESKHLEDEAPTKTEKKDRNKNKAKGTIADYALKARPEDYYLDHIPKTMRNKFRGEIDLKYVLDNTKVTLRGSYSVRDLREPTARKFSYKPVNRSKVIAEQEQEESLRKKVSDVHDIKMDTNPQEEKDSIRDGTTVREENDAKGSKDTSQDKMFRETTEFLGLPKIAPRKFNSRTARTLSIASDSKTIKDFLKKGSHEVKENSERVEYNDCGIVERKSEYLAPRLKYEQVDIGKMGKKFVRGKDEGQDVANVEREFVYKDKRLDYAKEHEGLARGDIDSNIEDLIQKLLHKQNQFSKSFGKYAIKNRNHKKIK